MNLLFSRSQKRASFLSLIPLRIGGTVTFRLNAELELSSEELALARKYSFTKATLIYSDAGEDLARAYRPAFFLSILATLAFLIFVPSSVFGGDSTFATLYKALAVFPIGMICFIVFALQYFFALRKLVTVDQLTNGGRVFLCHSVVELDEQEAEIHDICRRFYLTLEKAKNWGGREINPLPVGEPFYLNAPEGSEQQGAIDAAMLQAGQAAAKLVKPFRTSTQHEEGSEEPRTFFQKVGDVLQGNEAPQEPQTPPSATPPSHPTQPPYHPPPAPRAPAEQRPAPPPAPIPSTPPSSPLQGTPHPLAPKPLGDEPSGF